MNAITGLTGLIVKLVLGVFGLVMGTVMISYMLTTVSADEIVVKQDMVGGTLHVWDTPGVHWQNFGTITRYKRSAQLWFSAKEEEGKKIDESIKVRFSDGGHGNISGSLRYTLPTSPDKMIVLHQTYHSMDAIDHELVRQVVNKGVYMSGPLMSSRESYAERRADLINYITSQIVYGVYRTEHDTTKALDPITGQEKTVDIVRPKLNPQAPEGIEREESSPIQAMGMNATNITINGIDYDPTVEAQIKQQQEAVNAVQQAIVNSRKAEQDALTMELQGKAKATEAKWTQEVMKATATTAAEQEKAVAITQAEKAKEVASLSLETAKLSAQQTMTTARAETDAKRLSVAANNNLQERLEAYVEVQKFWAAAYGAQRQVPDVQVGPASGGGSNATPNLMELLAVKTARELSVQAKP
jgi:regulator of protease activity HflC (stomatin/prohibitin superfamily)